MKEHYYSPFMRREEFFSQNSLIWLEECLGRTFQVNISVKLWRGPSKHELPPLCRSLSLMDFYSLLHPSSPTPQSPAPPRVKLSVPSRAAKNQNSPFNIFGPVLILTIKKGLKCTFLCPKVLSND